MAVAMKYCVVEKEQGVSHYLCQLLLKDSHLKVVVQESLSYCPEGEAKLDTLLLKMKGPLVGEEGENTGHQGTGAALK